jgi:hypothetical protein
VAINFPTELLDLERTAWVAAQQGALTADQAAAVHAATVAFSEEAGLPRLDVEMGLKRVVRHPETVEA